MTRFAPAPTGFLHLGHVVNALHVWRTARTHGGRVLLRIEDHDRQRARPRFDAAILEDLEWLGFQPDEPVSRQSERDANYRQALARLGQAGLVYTCTCSRKARCACASKTLEDAPGRSLRVRMPRSDVAFEDLRLGPQRQHHAGDVVVRDRLGHWTYHFAVTVDDMDQGVTHVIRGEDLAESTARQILLAELLGRDQPPRFLHHPLVMKTPDQKLSKSDSDTGIRDLRAAGWGRDRVLEEAARLGEPFLTKSAWQRPGLL